MKTLIIVIALALLAPIVTAPAPKAPSPNSHCKGPGVCGS